MQTLLCRSRGRASAQRLLGLTRAALAQRPRCRWPIGTLVALAASAGGLASAPVARATIFLGQSVAGVKLGDTKAQVKQLLGEEGGRTNTVYYYRGLGVNVYFKAGRVVRLQAETNGQRTTKGIYAGSSRAQLKAAYPNAQCEHGANGPESLYCTITTRFRGRLSYTGFDLEAPANGVYIIEVWW